MSENPSSNQSFRRPLTFSTVSVEIQTLIWEAYEDDPNVVTLIQIDGYKVTGQGPVRYSNLLSRPPPTNGKEEYGIYQTRKQSPAILQVCRLARRIHLEQYVVLFRQQCPAWYNPRVDVLFLKNLRPFFHLHFSKEEILSLSSARMLMILDNEEQHPGNRLARHLIHDFVSQLKCFPNIEMLILEDPCSYPMPFHEIDAYNRQESQLRTYMTRLEQATCVDETGQRRAFWKRGHPQQIITATDYTMYKFAETPYTSCRHPEHITTPYESSRSAPRHILTCDLKEWQIALERL